MTKTHTSRTPPIIVHNAPKVKQALLNEFEQTQRIRLPVSLRHALMTLNYKDLGNTLAFVSKRIVDPKASDKTEKENKK
ncbi:hypothetical protein [Lactococcus garvieae]|uniref:hypothetical protein n=1 Tax=Lactococcus garvieae TaxID=1363 RepID=UPI00037A5AD2|nr:hypothetical protein [Lactococcus garvieae]